MFLEIPSTQVKQTYDTGIYARMSASNIDGKDKTYFSGYPCFGSIRYFDEEFKLHGSGGNPLGSRTA